jgi:hypothetical protein
MSTLNFGLSEACEPQLCNVVVNQIDVTDEGTTVVPIATGSEFQVGFRNLIDPQPTGDPRKNPQVNPAVVINVNAGETFDRATHSVVLPFEEARILISQIQRILDARVE